jgi:copper homeostasis protein CutC
MSVLGHYRLEIYKDLTSGVNIQIAQATSILQRIFENYKGKIYFLTNSGLRVQNKLLGKIEVGEMITEVLTLLLTPILPIL